MDIIDYYYWISSDWAYFGNPRLKQISTRHGVRINYRPVDLVMVYARTGGIQLQHRSEERKEYRFVEMARFRDILNMPIVLEPRNPPVTGKLPAGVVIAAQSLGVDVHNLNHAIMTALWADDQDIEDPAVLDCILHAQGLDSHQLLERAKSQDTSRLYDAYTEEAISRGVFGAPFYFFNGEPFWGQDRLDLLDRAITRHQGQAR